MSYGCVVATFGDGVYIGVNYSAFQRQRCDESRQNSAENSRIWAGGDGRHVATLVSHYYGHSWITVLVVVVVVVAHIGVSRRAGNEKFMIRKNWTMNKSERRVFGRWDTTVISRAGFIKRIVASRGRDSSPPTSLFLSLVPVHSFVLSFCPQERLPLTRRIHSYRCGGHDGTWIGDKKINGGPSLFLDFARIRVDARILKSRPLATNRIDLIVPNRWLSRLRNIGIEEL